MSHKLYEQNLNGVRKGITPPLILSVICYFVISLILKKVLTLSEEIIMVSTIFISTGIFFLLLDIIDRKSGKLIRKNSIKTTGEIINCEKHIERNSDGVIEASYYIIDYLINYNGEEIIVQKLAENKRKIGKIDKIYYNPTNKTIFLVKDVDQTSDKGALLVIFGICVFIGALIIIFPLLGGIFASSDFWFYIFVGIVSIGTIIAGILILKNVFKDLKKEREYKKIDAIIIGNDEGSYHDRDRNKMIQTFYPIYEYYHNGIKKTYKCPNNGFLEIGSKQIIMINEEGDIYTKRKKGGDIFGGIFCILIGIISFLSIIISLMS